MYKAVIFDLDGTLVNSIDDLAVATNYALEKHGFNTYTVEEYKYLVGGGMVKLIEGAIADDTVSKETFDSVFDCFLNYYRSHYLVYTKAYDGIIEAVSNIKEKGLKLAVISNKADEMTQIIVKELFGDVFDKVTGKREGYPTKPNPALTLKIIDEMGLKPEECIFVGDSGMDCANAVNSGCYPLGVLWGFRKEDELFENGAKSVIKHPNELVHFIEEILND